MPCLISPHLTTHSPRAAFLSGFISRVQACLQSCIKASDANNASHGLNDLHHNPRRGSVSRKAWGCRICEYKRPPTWANLARPHKDDLKAGAKRAVIKEVSERMKMESDGSKALCDEPTMQLERNCESYVSRGSYEKSQGKARKTRATIKNLRR